MLMKKVATVLSVIAIMAFAACADSSDSKESEQIDQPVLNSGPETEGDRATDAVKDSAAVGSDSTIHHDADAPSTPH